MMKTISFLCRLWLPLCFVLALGLSFQRNVMASELPKLVVTYATPKGDGVISGYVVIPKDSDYTDFAVTAFVRSQVGEDINWYGPKPSYDNPAVLLNEDGTFSMQYTIESVDRYTAGIHVFLLPSESYPEQGWDYFSFSKGSYNAVLTDALDDCVITRDNEGGVSINTERDLNGDVIYYIEPWTGFAGMSVQPNEVEEVDEDSSSEDDMDIDMADVGLSVFTDIANHWAYEDIAYVLQHYLMKGTSPTEFAPHVPMTRGMFVTVLSRFAGQDIREHTLSRFGDVPEGSYYLPAIEWAAEQGIVAGTSENTFEPEAALSRQDMAVMFCNFASARGYFVPLIQDLEPFVDDADILPYALSSVYVLQQANILGGRPGGFFDPMAFTSRAEASAVFRRFIETIIVS